MTLHTVHLEPTVADVLVYALHRTIDDLAARAIISERHDPELGPVSAEEYRTDIHRLRSVLDQIAPDRRAPDPEWAAVRWFDAVYTIVDGEPVRMVSALALHDLLDVRLGLHAREADERRLQLVPSTTPPPEHTAAARPSLVPATGLTRPSPISAHRLAPGCDPLPTPPQRPGGGTC